MKMQHKEREKVFANHKTNKGLFSKIYKLLIQLKKKKNYQKIGRRTEETFLQRTHTDDQQAHEKMLNITNLLKKCQS